MKTTRESVDPRRRQQDEPADRFAFVTKMREQGQKQFDAVKTAAERAARDARRRRKRPRPATSCRVSPSALARCAARLRGDAAQALTHVASRLRRRPSSPLGARNVQRAIMARNALASRSQKVLSCRSRHRSRGAKRSCSPARPQPAWLPPACRGGRKRSIERRSPCRSRS